MNLRQIKTDLDNGIIISKPTWSMLLDAAMMMEEVLKKSAEGFTRHPAIDCLEELEKL